MNHSDLLQITTASAESFGWSFEKVSKYQSTFGESWYADYVKDGYSRKVRISDHCTGDRRMMSECQVFTFSTSESINEMMIQFFAPRVEVRFAKVVEAASEKIAAGMVTGYSIQVTMMEEAVRIAKKSGKSMNIYRVEFSQNLVRC